MKNNYNLINLNVLKLHKTYSGKTVEYFMRILRKYTLNFNNFRKLSNIFLKIDLFCSLSLLSFKNILPVFTKKIKYKFIKKTLNLNFPLKNQNCNLSLFYGILREFMKYYTNIK